MSPRRPSRAADPRRMPRAPPSPGEQARRAPAGDGGWSGTLGVRTDRLAPASGPVSIAPPGRRTRQAHDRGADSVALPRARCIAWSRSSEPGGSIVKNGRSVRRDRATPAARPRPPLGLRPARPAGTSPARRTALGSPRTALANAASPRTSAIPRRYTSPFHARHAPNLASAPRDRLRRGPPRVARAHPPAAVGDEVPADARCAHAGWRRSCSRSCGIREEVLDGLVEASGREDARTILRVPLTLGGEVEANRTIRTRLARPAIEIYTGVLHDGLDWATSDRRRSAPWRPASHHLVRRLWRGLARATGSRPIARRSAPTWLGPGPSTTCGKASLDAVLTAAGPGLPSTAARVRMPPPGDPRARSPTAGSPSASPGRVTWPSTPAGS